jgi:hypothetical protein
MLVDALGNLWVSDARVSSEDQQNWTVFDRNGRLLGTVSMPPELVVSEIGADYVIGHQMDDLEIQHVLVYQLLKPAT